MTDKRLTVNLFKCNVPNTLSCKWCQKSLWFAEQVMGNLFDLNIYIFSHFRLQGLVGQCLPTMRSSLGFLASVSSGPLVLWQWVSLWKAKGVLAGEIWKVQGLMARCGFQIALVFMQTFVMAIDVDKRVKSYNTFDINCYVITTCAIM